MTVDRAIQPEGYSASPDPLLGPWWRERTFIAAFSVLAIYIGIYVALLLWRYAGPVPGAVAAAMLGFVLAIVAVVAARSRNR